MQEDPNKNLETEGVDSPKDDGEKHHDSVKSDDVKSDDPKVSSAEANDKKNNQDSEVDDGPTVSQKFKELVDVAKPKVIRATKKAYNAVTPVVKNIWSSISTMISGTKKTPDQHVDESKKQNEGEKKDASTQGGAGHADAQSSDDGVTNKKTETGDPKEPKE